MYIICPKHICNARTHIRVCEERCKKTKKEKCKAYKKYLKELEDDQNKK